MTATEEAKLFSNKCYSETGMDDVALSAKLSKGGM